MSSCSLTLFSVMSICTPFFVKLFFDSLFCHVVHLDPLVMSSIWTPFFVKSLLKHSLLCHVVHVDPLLCQVVLSVMSSIWTPFFVKSLLTDSLLCHVVHLDPLLCQVTLEGLSSPSCRPFGPPSFSSCSLTLFSVMLSIWTAFFVKLFFDSLLCHVHLDPLLCSSCSLTLFSVMSSIWTLFFVK